VRRSRGARTRLAEALPSQIAVSAASTGPAAASIAVTCGENRTAAASSRSSTAASTIHASSPTHCSHDENSSAAPAASPWMRISCTAVAAFGGSASQTFNVRSRPIDAALSA
jgi:hypothetical protein